MLGIKEDAVDLYEELGVSKDASTEEIRSAYRKQAAQLHPDQPTGDEERFKRVSHAHLILADPQKRERYDKDGDERPMSEEEREAIKAVEKLAGHFKQLFGMAEFRPEQHNAIKAVRKMLKIERKEAEAALAEADATLLKIERTMKRMRHKAKRKGKVSGVLDAMVRSVREGRTKIENELKVIARTHALLEGYEYETDPETKLSPEEQRVAEQMSALRKNIELRFGGGRRG